MSSGHPLGAPPPEGEAHPHSAPGDGVNAMAVSATLHCLSGCAIGEVAGLMIGAGAGLGNAWTVVISIALAFEFGYTLSVLPLLAGGLALGSARCGWSWQPTPCRSRRWSWLTTWFT